MQPALTDDLIVQLVTGCQRGETSAVERLYELYADRLYRFLLARSGDSETAADLTTELFLRVIKAIGAFRLDPERPAAAFSGWLYRIAANLAGEHFRAQKRVAWQALDDCDAGPAGDFNLEELAERREELAELAQAMNGLNDEQRMVLTAKFVESMSNADIAAWMGKSEGAVKSIQHRALRTLARLMRPGRHEENRSP